VETAAALKSGWPTDKHRHANSTFVDATLRTRETTVKTLGALLAYTAKRRTIIAGEQDNGIVFNTLALKDFKYSCIAPDESGISPNLD